MIKKYWGRLALAAFVFLLLASAYYTLRFTILAAGTERLSSVDTNDMAAHGELLFQTRGCAGCHTLYKADAHGDTGPNLDTRTQYPQDYLYTAIANPNSAIVPDCPEGACRADVMPPYAQILSEAQINALVSYIRDE